MGFVTVMLTYENTEQNAHGPGPASGNEQFGWIVRINGLAGDVDFQNEFPKFVLTEDKTFYLSSFEENQLSFDAHDQFHPPMALVTKFLGWLDDQGYMNTSSALSAEKNEITYCMWNFQRRSLVL